MYYIYDMVELLQAACYVNCLLFSGSRTGAIHQHDVRVASHHVGSFLTHTQEVCGLQWSADGRYLASGANDNLLCIWDQNTSTHSSPLFTLSQHLAAVKVRTTVVCTFLYFYHMSRFEDEDSACIAWRVARWCSG